jgi:hypothetical protein
MFGCARTSGRGADARSLLVRCSSYPATALGPLEIDSIPRQADLGIRDRYCDLAHQGRGWSSSSLGRQ